ncbi:uncharacterized protein [Eurosta solidaginis]|uniref:uncharacterized protein n=1 Tax=Eurosta solidaginis TaxID=178769 RepID=UPI003530646A
MCKFTNRLFVFTLLALLGVPITLLVDAAALRTNHRDVANPKMFDLLLFDDYDNNYDIHYDQRQKGNENLRVKMDGFFIEMPPSDKEEGAEDIIKDIYEDLLMSLSGGSDSRGSSSSSSSSSTTPPIDLTQQVEHDKEKKLNLERHADMRDAIEEVLAKRDVEGRNVVANRENGLLAVNREPEGRRVSAITKQHFSTLLNLLRRMRRN